MKQLKTLILAILCLPLGGWGGQTAKAETVTYTISGGLEQATSYLTITASGSATGDVTGSWNVATTSTYTCNLPGGITIKFYTDKSQGLVAQNGILQMQSDITSGCYIQLSRTSGDDKRIYHYTLKEEDGDIIYEAMNAASGDRYYYFQRIDLKTIVVSYADFADIADGAYSGSGTTADDPYIINNRMQLDLLARLTNGGNTFSGKFFKQGDNISYTHSTDWNDASSTENNFVRIGTPDNRFCGTFDGDGNTISGIRIYKGGNEETDRYQGLFGYIGSGGTVKGVSLADARITGYKCTGGIAGYNNEGTIEECTVASNVCIHAVKTKSTYHGGIVGEFYQGIVQRCVSAASVTATAAIATNCDSYGSIVGTNNRGTVQNCLALGAKVDAVNSYYGAIVGQNNVGTLQNNYYSVCTVGSATTGIGIGGNIYSVPSDYTTNDGAVPALRNDADNATAIGLLAAVPANFGNYSVSLDGRTLQAGGWNTFCAPFSADIPNGWTVRRLYSSSLSGDALTLGFLPVGSSIEAGKPYLVKVTSSAANPTFSGVRVVSGTTTTETTYADFVPVMNPTNLTGGDESVLFVTGGNTLTYPYTSGNINAFRAYFQLLGAAAGGGEIKAFNMSFEDDADGIREAAPLNDKGQMINVIYNLAGQRINRMQKGINIVNGKKVIIK